MMSRALLVSFLLLVSVMALAGEVAVRNADSLQLLEVAADVTLNGDVSVVDVAVQYPEGVLYIDMRTPEEEGVEATRDEALRLGMRYENIPVDGASIVAGQVAALEALLKQRSHFQHTVLRCGSGNRAAMMWGATRINAGEEIDQVMTQLQNIVTKAPIDQALRAYAGNTDR